MAPARQQTLTMVFRSVKASETCQLPGDEDNLNPNEVVLWIDGTDVKLRIPGHGDVTIGKLPKQESAPSNPFRPSK